MTASTGRKTDRSPAADLPTGSVAEFRKAAWPVIVEHMGGQIVMRIYFTWVAIGFGLAGVVFGIAGMGYSLGGGAAILAVGVLILALAVRRVVRLFRQGTEVRKEVDDLSRDVDARARDGLIPLRPPGWAEALLPPPHERRSSWV